MEAVLWDGACPRGSKYAMFEVSGSENHTDNGFWDTKPSNVEYLDPLRTRLLKNVFFGRYTALDSAPTSKFHAEASSFEEGIPRSKTWGSV